MGTIMTVNGPINEKDLGLALPHEHILVDFIGAKKTGKHRYNKNEVIEIMLPYLNEIKGLGVKSFFDCTPMFLGRDVELLRKLSQLTGIHIISNTGQYKKPYLPEETFEITASELSEKWILEYEKGIEKTNIRPGFIKTAVEPDNLDEIQRKVIRAAAITSRNTSLTIATHTLKAKVALEILDILKEEDVSPSKWIFVHAQNDTSKAIIEIAKRGAYIELDGIGALDDELHLKTLIALLDAGYEKKVLLSQDAGWYNVGEEKGGNIRPYTNIFTKFIPMMKKAGINDKSINQIMVINPSKAYKI